MELSQELRREKPAASRMNRFSPYIFRELMDLKRKQESAQGYPVLSLAVGDPDLPTPAPILEVLQQSLWEPRNHSYSPYEGTMEFRKAACHFMEKRFGVSLNPESECTALIGSKEGLGHAALGFLEKGDRGGFPDPGYPIFESSILMADAEPVPFPLKWEHSFCPDMEQWAALLHKHSPKVLYVNFPSNPTGAQIAQSDAQKLVHLCCETGCILLADAAYSEIYMGKNNAPLSFLQCQDAHSCVLEFHSLSKTFNMTGMRIGFAVGNKDLVKTLVSVKTYFDSGPLKAVQQAGAYALDHAAILSDPIRAIYARRMGHMRRMLEEARFEFNPTKATFYAWARVPGMFAHSMQLAEAAIKLGVLVTPGIGFGKQGEGFFRLSATVSDEKLTQALDALSGLQGLQ